MAKARQLVSARRTSEYGQPGRDLDRPTLPIVAVLQDGTRQYSDTPAAVVSLSQASKEAG